MLTIMYSDFSILLYSVLWGAVCFKTKKKLQDTANFPLFTEYAYVTVIY